MRNNLVNGTETLCRSHSHVVLNFLVCVVAVGLWAPGGAARVGVGVLRRGFGLRRCGGGLFLVFADVPGRFVEGEGVLVVASQEEGVGGAARRVVAGTDRFGCDEDETKVKEVSLKCFHHNKSFLFPLVFSFPLEVVNNHSDSKQHHVVK